MLTLNDLYAKYKLAKSSVTFFHWLEGEVPSIAELAKDLGYTSVDRLKLVCKALK